MIWNALLVNKVIFSIVGRFHHFFLLWCVYFLFLDYGSHVIHKTRIPHLEFSLGALS